MPECLILNDASLPFISANDCEKNLDVFFSILHRANSQGIDFYRADELEGNWNSLIYAEGFEFGKWINEISDQDQCRLVKSVISNVKCPLFSTKSVDSENSMKDVLFVLSSDRDIEVQALGVASLINTHGVSFASHDNWKVNPVVIIRQWDENGAVKEQAVDVPNVCSMPHLDDVLVEFDAKQKSNRSYLSSLTALGNNDFPNLIFCESALKNLCSPSVTTFDFPKIIDALVKLDGAICDSRNQAELIINSELKISGESPETMQTPKHARKRLFKHPNLGKALFESHVKNFPDGKRMHILADYANNTVCVGYFGRHLSTVSDPK